MSPAKDEEVGEEYVPGERSQMWIHEGHVEYLKAEYGDDIFQRRKPESVIAIAFATRRAYRESEFYTDAKENYDSEKQAEAERIAEEKAERKSAREAAAAEKAEAKKAAKGGGKKAPAKKGSGSSRKKAAPRKKASSSEDPFDD